MFHKCPEAPKRSYVFTHLPSERIITRGRYARAVQTKVPPRRAQAEWHSLARDWWRFWAVRARAPLKEKRPAGPSSCQTAMGRRPCLSTSARRRRTSAPRRSTDTPTLYSR